jgi:hypothetical protein
MGYTHYWESNSRINSDEWTIICGAARNIVSFCEHEGIRLFFEYDSNEPPQIDKQMIRFNGSERDGHETFILLPEQGFSFCKTAQKPYDLAVVLMLLAVNTFASDNALDISSDGDYGDWEEGINVFKDLFGVDPKVPEKIRD